MDPMGKCNLVKFLFVCPASQGRTSKMTACVQCVSNSLNESHQKSILEIVTICRFCGESWKTRDKHAIFTYNMLRVVKLYDLYRLNASDLVWNGTLPSGASGLWHHSFRFEIPWCALSCHKLNGENGENGGYLSSKAGIVQRNLGFLKLKHMHLVLLICCIVAIFFPAQKPGCYFSNQFTLLPCSALFWKV